MSRIQQSSVCRATHSADKYAAVAHRHHEGIDAAPGCASCDMPVRTYMVVDRRHDHSVRIPRPDLSVKLGTPNACNDYHADKTAEWAAADVRIGALEMLEGAPVNRLWPLVARLLSDSSRGVRIRAAALLAPDRPPASPRPTVRPSRARRPSSSRPSGSMPTGRKRDLHSEISTRNAV